MADEHPDSAGWSGAKVIGLVLGILGMAGFGVCSLCGLVMGVSDRTLLTTVLVFSLPGLVLAGLCFLLVRKMVRLARAPRQ